MRQAFLPFTAASALCLVLLGSVISKSGMYNSLFVFKEISFLLSVGYLLLLVGISFLYNVKVYALSRIDYAVLSWFIYLALTTLYRVSYLPNLYHNCVLNLGLIIVYFSIKQLVLNGLLSALSTVRIYSCLLIMQASIGLLQVFSIIHSNHSFFAITGAFFNPAPYAIYLASLSAFVLPFLFYAVKKRTGNYQSIFLAAVVAISIVISIQCNSRASWIGLSGGIVFTVAMVFRLQILRFVKTLRYKMAWAAAVLLVLAGSGTWLFYLKEDSATGRLLIWKISARMLKDHLFTGTGSGTFAVRYLEYQYAYFKHPDTVSEVYRGLAGDIRFAFNDLLQICCEGGLPAGLIFMSILVFLASHVKKTYKNLENPDNLLVIACSSALLVILLSGLFSYPLTQLSVKVHFWILTAVVASSISKRDSEKCSYIIKKSGILRISACLLPLVMSGFFVFYGTRKWIGFNRLDKIAESGSSAALFKLYPILSGDASYLLVLGQSYGSEGLYRQAIPILERAKLISPDSDIYYNLGGAYQMTAQYGRAESNYRFVETAIPGLITPKYLLAKLYYFSGQQEKWRQKSRELVRFKPKVESADTEYIKEDIKQLLLQSRQ